MNTSHNKYDTIESLIYSEGLRIKSLEFGSNLDTMYVHLNNNTMFVIPITFYKGLRNATSEKLNHFELIGGGTGIHWPQLNEDLSLKGFLKEYLRQKVKTESELVIA